jgi:hypothetical protein
MDMSVTNDLLDRWKKAKGIESDNQAALKLHLTRATVSAWRVSEKEATAATIIAMATDLGEDPTGYVLMAEAHKQKYAESSRALESLAKKFFPYAAAALLIGIFAKDAESAQVQMSTSDILHNDRIVYKGVNV